MACTYAWPKVACCGVELAGDYLGPDDAIHAREMADLHAGSYVAYRGALAMAWWARSGAARLGRSGPIEGGPRLREEGVREREERKKKKKKRGQTKERKEEKEKYLGFSRVFQYLIYSIFVFI